MKNIIHIYGASGSGTSTLGRALSEHLEYKFMDTDEYFWMPTNPKFTTERPLADRLALMQNDIDNSDNVIISGSLVNWGDVFIPQFTLAVRLETPTEIRIDRINKRDLKRFGERVCAGGDMYEQHEDFVKWAARYDNGSLDIRSKLSHDLWQQKLTCPLLVLDGTLSLDTLIKKISKKIKKK